MNNRIDQLLEELKAELRYEAQEEVFNYIDLNYNTDQISVVELKEHFRKEIK